MDRYPILALIVRFGSPVAIVLALVGAVLCFLLLQPALGWAAIAFAVLAAGVIYVLVKSYVELVVLITEMLVPR